MTLTLPNTVLRGLGTEEQLIYTRFDVGFYPAFQVLSPFGHSGNETRPASTAFSVPMTLGPNCFTEFGNTIHGSTIFSLNRRLKVPSNFALWHYQPNDNGPRSYCGSEVH
ncbi:hypothetical protein PM082_008729 [Marasmius tenuissimus]|nr:hypothetical protein PM082_008729 [Marasmius tenuissimus]